MARRECGDISTLDGEDDAHPIVKRVSELSSQVTTIRARRVELQSMLPNIRNLAMANGDLSQVLPMMAQIVDCDPESVQTGMPVDVCFEVWTEEVSMPNFRARANSGA